MTKPEILNLLWLIDAAYGNFLQGRDPKAVAEVWRAVLGDIPFDEVKKAIVSYVRSEHFPPVPADIVKRVEAMSPERNITEGELWTLIRKAVCNGIYGYMSEWEKLPPICQKVVGFPRQLKDWAILESDALDTVVASNVQRSLRTMIEREKINDALPSGNIFAVIGQKLALVND